MNVSPSARSGVLALTLLCVLGSPLRAQGPVRDPFLSGFEVGRYASPRQGGLLHGLPADLLRPAEVDSAWIRAALDLFDRPRSVQGEDPVPVQAFLAGVGEADSVLVRWRQSRAAWLASLAGGRREAVLAGPLSEPLARASRVLAFFTALARADSATALSVAAELAAGPAPAPDRFIWSLRRRQLTRAGGGALDPADPWPELFDLGPYDRRNGWALWRAWRQEAGLPLLTRNHRTAAQAAALAGLSDSGITADDLAASGFSYEIRLGLGSLLLKGRERRDFMNAHPDPPWDFTAQGWWVRGMRLAAKGSPAVYESLAADTRLRSGWRMDLWRRASERRLLKGQWEQGLADLKRAVGLARYQAGTPGLRNRVGQLVEQAWALARARQRDQDAARIFDLSAGRLPEPQRATFLSRVEQWKKDGEQTEPDAVLSGAAAPLASSSVAARLPDPRQARRAFWRTWAELWNASPFNGAEASDPDTARSRALAWIVGELGAFDAGSASLWDRVLIREVYLYGSDAGVRRAPASLYSFLRPLVRDEPGLRCPLLGMAWALQDLRAVVGLATQGAGMALPPAVRETFLYPVPAWGPVRRALEVAETEPALLLAVARNESLFDPGVRSRAGALGWLQIMPFHYEPAACAAGAWADPAVSVAKGDGLLVENVRRYDGDPYRVLSGYNAGPGAVSRWDAQLGGQAPPSLYLAWIGYSETRRYVEKVLRDRRVYAGILSAASGPDDRNETGGPRSATKE